MAERVIPFLPYGIPPVRVKELGVFYGGVVFWV